MCEDQCCSAVYSRVWYMHWCVCLCARSRLRSSTSTCLSQPSQWFTSSTCRRRTTYARRTNGLWRVNLHRLVQLHWVVVRRPSVALSLNVGPTLTKANLCHLWRNSFTGGQMSSSNTAQHLTELGSLTELAYTLQFCSYLIACCCFNFQHFVLKTKNNQNTL